MSRYIAKQSVGQFKTGDEVTGLTPDRAQFLIAEGAIEEVKETPKPKARATAKDKE